MADTLTDVFDLLEDSLKKNIDHTYAEFSKLRAGKANPRILDMVMVDYYGNPTPMSQVANVSAPDPRTLMIQPWEKSMVAAIETAIINSNLGFNPNSDGDSVRINIPILTEERRKDLVKQVRTEAENSKIGIRNLRKEANESIKKLKTDGLSEDEAKDGEDQVQKLIDTYITKVDGITSEKEKEIMTV
jgi:ribosome recycling factor